MFERAWSGEPGSPRWTRLLAPLSFAYALGSAFARGRAAKLRQRIPTAHVIAVGNLTVGGTGKSSVARWLALEAAAAGASAAIVLRGHGARGARGGPRVVPEL